MSSSDPNSKIDLLDPPTVVRKKIKSAFCEEGNIEDNGLLAFVKAVLIPITSLKLEEGLKSGSTIGKIPFVGDGAPEGTVFTISRDPKFGESTHYSSYDDLELDFKDRKLHPKDLKDNVGSAIITLLEPIQKDYESNEEWKAVTLKAYPPAKPEVKEKKKKVSSGV